MEVRLFDLAHVPSELLREAEQEASRIFRAAGIALAWKAGSALDDAAYELEYRAVPNGRIAVPLACGSDPDVCRLDVRLVAHTSRFRSSALAEALPFARSGIRVNIFYDRIQKLFNIYPGAHSAILGHVLAHEIGHVLLGTNTHSGAGLMRGSWGESDFGRMAKVSMLFDKADIRRIQERVRTRRTPGSDQERLLALAR